MIFLPIVTKVAWVVGSSLLSVMVARNYHRVEAMQEANREAAWQCQMIPFAATGRGAFCDQVETMARRPLMLQLAIQTVEDLPWCGPWECPTNAKSPIMQVAVLVVILFFVLEIVKLYVIHSNRRNYSEYYGTVPQLRLKTR